MKYLLKIVINTLEGQYHVCELDLENDKIFQEFKKQRQKAAGTVLKFLLLLTKNKLFSVRINKREVKRKKETR